jgi:hypothetical protein
LACITALADQKAGHVLGAFNKALHLIGKSKKQGPTAFHDIQGRDAASGLGMPDVAILVSLLAG